MTTRGAKSITTKIVWEKCLQFEKQARTESIENKNPDLEFILADMIFWNLVDDITFEKPSIERIISIVSKYLS